MRVIDWSTKGLHKGFDLVEPYDFMTDYRNYGDVDLFILGHVDKVDALHAFITYCRDVKGIDVTGEKGDAPRFSLHYVSHVWMVGGRWGLPSSEGSEPFTVFTLVWPEY